MNLVLLLVLVSEVCIGFCAWLSPGCLRWLAAHLLTRADVLDFSRQETKRRMQFWSSELGLARDTCDRDTSEQPSPGPVLARH